MAIQSYLVYAKPGCRDTVAARLRTIPLSDIRPSETHDIVILVTETEGKSGTESLENQLAAIPEVDGYALVAGYSDELIAAEEK